MDSIQQKYQQLWKAIIRPPRAQYRQLDLDLKTFKQNELEIQRTDVQLTNKRGFKIKCSHYQPFIRPCKQLPCVIYLHGNSSCRLQGRSYIRYILSHDITLFTFDFSGCGNSEGEYISLGYYQRDDVQTVFEYLRSLGTVTSIGLWGRSMGAVTALMYADENPQIACIVCDSPFSNLEKLCKQLAQRYGSKLISFFSGIALSFLAKTIKQKNNFDISSLDPLDHVKKAFIPAFFIAAKDDDFILPKHTKKLYQAYSGQKIIKIVQGDHNSQRSSVVNQAISIFFYNNLHVDRLIVRDQAFIKFQNEQRQKQRKKLKQASRMKHKIDSNHQATYDNIFLNQYQDQEKMVQMAKRLSLLENQNSKKQTKQKKQDFQNKKQEKNKYLENNIQKRKLQSNYNISSTNKTQIKQQKTQNNEQKNKRRHKNIFDQPLEHPKHLQQQNFDQIQIDQGNPKSKQKI